LELSKVECPLKTIEERMTFKLDTWDAGYQLVFNMQAVF
jgi:hypothetical protein